jgi:uncharacterized protein (TIGR00369 family)
VSRKVASPPRGEVPRSGGGEIHSGSTSRAWVWLGLRLVETGDGSAVVEMTTTEDMANHSGFVHGGMISTLADSAMGRSLRTLRPGVVRAMSFDLKLSFINAAKVGETLRATGHVIHAGRRTAVADCRVEGTDGRLIATASATFAVTREKE